MDAGNKFRRFHAVICRTCASPSQGRSRTVPGAPCRYPRSQRLGRLSGRYWSGSTQVSWSWWSSLWSA